MTDEPNLKVAATALAAALAAATLKAAIFSGQFTPFHQQSADKRGSTQLKLGQRPHRRLSGDLPLH